MGRKRLVFKFFFGMGLLLWAALGLYRYLVDDENNQCEMTYMFEYPQYIVSYYLINLLKGLGF